MIEPKNREEQEIFAIEALKADVQQALHPVMKFKGLSRKAVAEKMGRSPAFITQLLSDDANLTLETIAKVFLAIGDTPRFSSEAFEEVLKDIADRRKRMDRPRVQHGLFVMEEPSESDCLVRPIEILATEAHIGWLGGISRAANDLMKPSVEFESPNDSGLPRPARARQIA